jgi:RNase P/RNase MRP subunit p30
VTVISFCARQINSIQTGGHRYDLIAVRPANGAVFLKAVEHIGVDIISLDLSQRGLTSSAPFFLAKPAEVLKALARGCVFEISLAGIVDEPDATKRRNFFTNACQLVSSTKGKGIVLVSSAKDPITMRSPHCAANLGTLLGLSVDQGIHALSSNCLSAVSHGKANRGTFKGTVGIVVEGGSKTIADAIDLKRKREDNSGKKEAAESSRAAKRAAWVAKQAEAAAAAAAAAAATETSGGAAPGSAEEAQVAADAPKKAAKESVAGKGKGNAAPAAPAPAASDDFIAF